MADLSQLIERVENLTGPDREIDAEIDAALFGGRAAHTFSEDCGGARLRKSYGAGTVFLNGDPNDNGGHVLTRHHRMADGYTASLDAAIALTERVLPGAKISLFIGHLTSAKDGSGSRAQVVRGKGPKCPHTGIRWPRTVGECFHAATPAIALLLATLRALKEQNHG